MTDFLNRVRQVITTTGTGSTIQLATTADGPTFFTMAQAGAVNGRRFDYFIIDGNNVEIHEKEQWTAASRQLTRGVPVASIVEGVIGTAQIELTGTARFRVFESAGSMMKVLRADFAQAFDPDELDQLLDNLGATTVGKDLFTAPNTAAARANLGLGSAATASASAFLQPGNDLGDIGNAGAARTNLGLGSAATQPSSAFLPAFPSGTRLLFQQTNAPTGWTKDTTHNDKALRIVSGAVGSGGVLAFSTVFGKTSTDATTLSISTMPSHGHNVPGSNGVDLPSGPYDVFRQGSNTFTDAAAAKGGGGSHQHGMDIRVQYVDVIIASKD